MGSRDLNPGPTDYEVIVWSIGNDVLSCKALVLLRNCR